MAIHPCGSSLPGQVQAEAGVSRTVPTAPDEGFAVNRVCISGQPVALTDGTNSLENGMEAKASRAFSASASAVQTGDSAAPLPPASREELAVLS